MKRAMLHVSSKAVLVILAGLSAIIVTSCANVKVGPKDASHSGQTGSNPAQGSSTGQKNGSDNQATPPPQDPSQMQVGQVPVSVAGDWTIGFQYNNTSLVSKVHLDQQGQQFHGNGTDTTGGTAFAINQGTINNGQVRFFKKYPNSPDVEYTGKIEVVADSNYHGPYMSGDYNTAYHGKMINDLWEAEMDLPNANQNNQQVAGGNPNQGAQQGGGGQGQGQGQEQQGGGQGQGQEQQGDANQEAPVVPDHAPDLSGKWNVGFEYNFKTIHSTMFLEQEGDRIVGRGIDSNTKEKFVVEKGWYHFPKLTIIRKYTKNKGSASSRTMMFKATVALLNDKDYQGPYLNGKTQGGGVWEAQLIK